MHMGMVCKADRAHSDVLPVIPMQSEFNAPVRTTKYPREVPPLPWYRRAVPQMLMAGFLPFSAIYIELYYIFASVWGHKARLQYPPACLFMVKTVSDPEQP